MKKILLFVSTLLCLSVCFTSCDALFDNLEGDLTKMTGEDMVSSDAGIQMLLADCYSYLPMSTFTSLRKSSTGYGAELEDFYTLNAIDSHASNYGFAGNQLYGVSGLKTFWSWSNIRSINSFIANVEIAFNNGVINETEAKAYTAEARFIRAYCYFVMVRNLGGVPIITEVLDQYYDGKKNEQLLPFAVRATEKETWDFVISELEAAAEDLPETPAAEFRASKYAALAIEARAALYAASVSKYWNNAAIQSTYEAVAAKKAYMEASYAPTYYAKCIEACEKIIGSNKFSLYGANPASVEEAVKNLGDMFVTKQNCEFIFGQSLNDGVSSSGDKFDVEFSPSQTVTTSSGCGRFSVTADLVDLFDNYTASFGRADGTLVTRADGQEKKFVADPTNNFKNTIDPSKSTYIDYVEYDAIDEPFKNKDARFQAWILYPDAEFRNTVIKIQAGLIAPDGTVSMWDDSKNVAVSAFGKEFYEYGDKSSEVSGFYNYSNSNTGNSYTTGFGLRKYLDPSSFQLYMKTFWYDVRYSEILLTYCEAVLESGATAKEATAKKYLNDIRHRAAFKDDIDLTLENVLHERRVELAFENDYLYTLHRRRAFATIEDDDYLRQRHTILPVVDLRGDKPQYIFMRGLHYSQDAAMGGIQSSTYAVKSTEYYLTMPDYSTNKYEANPIDNR